LCELQQISTLVTIADEDVTPTDSQLLVWCCMIGHQLTGPKGIEGCYKPDDDDDDISGSHGGEYELLESSGMYCHVVKYMLTNVSAVCCILHSSVGCVSHHYTVNSRVKIRPAAQ
jgi:hypothetical protein